MKACVLIFCAILLVDCNYKAEYPSTKKTEVKDIYFGKIINDPYRWLENDTSSATMDWVDRQNGFTNKHLSKIKYKEAIRSRLKELWTYERQSLPYKSGGFFIYRKNDGTQDQSVYYYKKGKDGEERLLMDPNTLSDDGTVTVSGFKVSNDSSYASYKIQRSGSDWTEIAVMDMKTLKPLKDHLKWIKFSGVSWYKNGFFYSSYGQPSDGRAFSASNEYQKVFYHEIGTEQSEDKLIYEDKDHPKRSFGAYVTDDKQYLILRASEGTSGNVVFFRPINGTAFTAIDTSFKTDEYVADHINGRFLMYTNDAAENYRLVWVDPKQPTKEKWEDCVSEKNYVLEGVSRAGGHIICQYLKDVRSKLEVYDDKGNYQYDVDLPGSGISSNLVGKKDMDIGYYAFSSYIHASSIYEFDFKTKSSSLFFKPEIDYNPSDYISEQIFYKSKDGTEVPMFITYKKGIKLDGANPCFLYGYGGFQISIKPHFHVRNLAFLERGGVYAVANLRGGKEYGEVWHKGGMLLNKQNVFDDFISAGEYLVEKGYTSNDKLAIHGRSNGGLLVGAVMTQRPDLAKVALPAVGVLDMLRYHKFTIGWAWAVEYGSSDDSIHFENLIKYSPLHNIKPIEYPATMVLTADHDDRVVPAHSFKFAATLQENQKGGEPALIRIDKKAGHGSGKPIRKQIDEWADIWAFTLHHLEAQ